MTRGVSAARVRAKQVAEQQLGETEAQLATAEEKAAAHIKTLRAATAEWEGLPHASRPPFPYWPSQAEGAARAALGPRLQSERDRLEERIQILRERVRDLTRAAEPLSPSALRRLEELLAAADADDELALRGIGPALMRTPQSRQTLREEYGL